MLARIEREALAGDVDAARELAREMQRRDDPDIDKRRRLARILLDAGERFGAISGSGDGACEPAAILAWRDQPGGGNPWLTHPVEVPLLWEDRHARRFACWLALGVLDRLHGVTPDQHEALHACILKTCSGDSRWSAASRWSPAAWAGDGGRDRRGLPYLPCDVARAIHSADMTAGDGVNRDRASLVCDALTMSAHCAAWECEGYARYLAQQDCEEASFKARRDAMLLSIMLEDQETPP